MPGDLAEYGVAPAVGSAGTVVEKSVVLQVDEELDAGRMRVLVRAMATVPRSFGQAVVGFVLQGRRAGFLFFHGRIEAAALDHEAVDDAVENGAS
jgi:hypothetical protein